MIEIIPDWTMIRTADAAEAEFAGFKWKGPGWYVDKTGQTLLAAPIMDGPNPSKLWDLEWREDQLFVFTAYSAPPFDSFDAVALAPLRDVDPRFAARWPFAAAASAVARLTAQELTVGDLQELLAKLARLPGGRGQKLVFTDDVQGEFDLVGWTGRCLSEDNFREDRRPILKLRRRP